MSSPPEECVDFRADLIIVLRENRSEAVFKNPKRKKIECVRVDGCAITTGFRCDYLVRSAASEYFVELKGSDVEHAIRQLRVTIRALSSAGMKGRRVAIVVCTRSPLASTEIQILRVSFSKELRAKLEVVSGRYTTTV